MAISSRLTLLLAAASVLDQTGAAGLPPSSQALSHLEYARAVENAPDGYVPKAVNCPSTRPSIRNGTTLSQQERDWTLQRRNETIPHIRDLLKRIAIPGFDSESYLSGVETNPTALPNIGLAVSGGGYRAMLNGAGALAAWDSRSDGSDADGNIGGLLQSATYLSGLSGGGWLVGSLYCNNFTSVQASMQSGSIWQTQDSLLEGPEKVSLRAYYTEIIGSVGDKDDAGYERSITDYWGRMLSYQLIDDNEDGGVGMTFSSIADDDEFKNARAPLPFIVAIGRDPGDKVISVNSTVFEFSPWELGSSDPTLHGYVPLKYVGSKFDGGELPESESCIAGFDNAGFVMGTSSSLFNQIVLYLQEEDSPYVPDGVPDFVIDALSSILNALGADNNDIADWTPNPFKGYNEAENESANSNRLTLVDGGEDLQNVPYHPHLLIERNVDVVFSIDSSADTESSWPDGASPIATYERSLESISEGTGFPVVPGKSTFLNKGLNTRPTFFGCDVNNVTTQHPLIVYIPNYPYLYTSNISTFSMSINESERDAIVQNGWAVATQLNGTRDVEWPVCVGCAMLHRSFTRTNTSIPAKCRECFDRYCWDGTLDESEPQGYWPELFSEPIDVQSAAVHSRFMGGSAIAAIIATVAGMVLAL